ncbi:MAG TPA: PEPxxWA-CTERM sorting domain-containing protein [Caulobacteraceae bacterium]|jgi:hypothetical protein|nr:PEPxxWA-CTERM sorting domain-containing protein [Caulobacteraceae bacterium]
MLKKVLATSAAAAAFFVLAGVEVAQATTTYEIDFSADSAGIAVTGPFDGLATFSLQGAGNTGADPHTGTGYLLNEPGLDTTTNKIEVYFSAPVQDVTFTFNNFGTASGSCPGTPGYAPGCSYAVAKNIGGTVLGTVNLGATESFSTVNPITGGDIQILDFANGGNTWPIGVGEITFTTVDATITAPEPSTWALMISGFGLLGYAMRRRMRMALRTA